MMMIKRLYRLITRLSEIVLLLLALAAVGLFIFFGLFAFLAVARLLVLALIVGAVLLVMFAVLKALSD